jgi:hypothetical protein
MPSVDIYRPLRPPPTHKDPFQAMDVNGLKGEGETVPIAGLVVASDAYCIPLFPNTVNGAVNTTDAPVGPVGPVEPVLPVFPVFPYGPKNPVNP